MGYLTNKFLREIGFANTKGRDAFAFMSKRLGNELARRLEALMDAFCDDDSSRREFYDVKNTTLDVSLTVSNAVQYDFFVHALEHLEENVDEIGENVLFVGCDCGIEPCFLARLKPDATITAIDITEAAIKNGQELANRLGVNVNFQCVSYEDVKGVFDTIISFKFAHEVVSDTLSSRHIFDSFQKKREINLEELLPLANTIGNLLSDYGVLIALERFFGIRQLAWMDALNSNGVETIALETVKGSHDEKFALTFAQKCPQDQSHEEIWFEYYSQDCDYSAPQFTGIQSEIFIAMKAGELIRGYYVMKDDVQYGKVAVYKHSNDDTAIILEISNFSEAQSSVYDISQLDEALKCIEDHAKECPKLGYEVLLIN